MRFVRAVAEDGVPLDGVVFEPNEEPHGFMLFVHGAGSHFYQRLYQVLGVAFAAAGYRALSGNNRGHDLGAYLPNDGPEVMLGGSAWEHFADSILDIGAWIDLLEAEARSGDVRLTLLGHSLGAAKVAHYAATTRDPRVAALIGCSGLGFGSRFFRGRPPNLEHAAFARHLVEAGRGDELLDRSIQRRFISARTFLERYERMSSHTGASSDLARISVPLLAIYATEEGGTLELLADIQSRAVGAARCDTYLVQGADHDYHGHETVVAAEVLQWVGKVLAAP